MEQVRRAGGRFDILRAVVKDISAVHIRGEKGSEEQVMWIFGGSTYLAKEEPVQRLRGEQAFNPIKEAGVAGPCE